MILLQPESFRQWRPCVRCVVFFTDDQYLSSEEKGRSFSYIDLKLIHKYAAVLLEIYMDPNTN